MAANKNLPLFGLSLLSILFAYHSSYASTLGVSSSSISRTAAARVGATYQDTSAVKLTSSLSETMKPATLTSFSSNPDAAKPVNFFDSSKLFRFQGAADGSFNFTNFSKEMSRHGLFLTKRRVRQDILPHPLRIELNGWAGNIIRERISCKDPIYSSEIKIFGDRQFMGLINESSSRKALPKDYSATETLRL